MLEGILVCHHPKKTPVVDCEIEKEANLSHTTSPRPLRSFRLAAANCSLINSSSDNLLPVPQSSA